ncbi:calcium-binding protein [Streptomyces sp. NBC_00094]|uniref:calcium-binding protein n=1 Tax=Streptomyces sp. NBC_00094 TaxID=2903620 RepID=UPI00224F17B8|nr:calcium-binding protein [Streptomyces sp. NBC_00094]MCX5388557.1 calcium-binding protein [Streptomyces sp. NBC_00094]
MTHTHPRPPRWRRGPRGRAGAPAVLAAALVLTLSGAALAAPGDPDPGFGPDGRVVTPFPGYAEGHDIARQADGKLVVAGLSEGGFALARYLPDGGLDPAFGTSGLVTSAFGGGAHSANAVAVQPADGKIVVAGTTEVFAEEGGGCCFFSVARYLPDGTLDAEFGDGGLVRVEEFGGSADGADVAVQSDGRIVAAGKGAGGGFALVRLDTEGDLDPSLGGDGAVVAGFTPGSPQDAGGIARSMALQADGKIVSVGYVGNTAFDIGVARYLPDGSLDPGFGGGDGMVSADFGSTEFGNAVAVQPDGKILAAGSGGAGFALLRYNADGSPDAGFGTGGRTSVAFPGDGGIAYGMALQQGGKIVLAGRADDPNSSEANDFGLARFNANGTVDTGFGGDGFVVTGFGDFDEARAVLVQPDGKIVAAGYGAGFAFALARYQGGDATPPPTPYADLSVTTTSTATVSIGDRVSYTVTVANRSTSTATATGVTLTDTLAGAGVTLTSATPSQGTCTTTATRATCALGSLAPGSSATLALTAEPRSTGTLTHTAAVGATQSDPVASDNTVTTTTSVNNARGCTIIGTSGPDTLNGGYGNDVICGLGGNDIVRASYGHDTVHGGYGNDNLDGSFGDDTINGGPGNDTLTGAYGNDRLTTTDAVLANDTANGGYGTDTCTTDPGDARISCP